VVLVHLTSLSLRLAALGLSLILWRRIRDFRVGVLSLLAAVMVLVEVRAIQGGGVARMAVEYPERVTWSMLLISLLLLMVMSLLWGVFGRERARTSTLEAMLASLHDGVVRIDSEGRVLEMNLAAQELTGWRADETAGQPVERMLHVQPFTGSGRTGIAELLDPDGDDDLQFRAQLETRMGLQLEVDIHATRLTDEDDNLEGAVIVLHDRTHVRKAEEELRRADKLESLGVLAGGIAHDFNNLLTGVSGNVSLAMEHLSADSESLALLQRIERAGTRAKALSRQLLTFASGGTPLRKDSSITDLLKESVSFCLAGRAIDCDLQVADDLHANVDRGQMAQVVQNLVINACDAMGGEGTLTVSGELLVDTDDVPGLPKGDYIFIRVGDQGRGIPREALRRVFEPYFTTKARGTGLGLAVAHSIIRQHEGAIQIESEPGSGTEVRFWLPTSDAPMVTELPDYDFNPQEGIRILLMDDDQVVSEVAEEMLSRLGFQVTSTYEGREAVQAYKAAQEKGNPYHLVLLDLTVPGGMGGLETLTALRKLDPKVRAIGTSGYSGKAALGSLEDHGFVAALPKPFTLNEMRAVIAESLVDVPGMSIP